MKKKKEKKEKKTLTRIEYELIEFSFSKGKDISKWKSIKSKSLF